MHQLSKKHAVRICGVGIAVAVTVIAGTMSGSCVFDTKTNFCEQWGLRCKEGQECAATEPTCIDIGGCGNMHRDPGEVCDDGNTKDGDGCSSNCMSDETCGNGIIDMAAGESCDDGNTRANDGCSPDCHIESEVCGNGIIEKDIGEICDDGNMTPDDGCSANCKSNEACGNGIIDNDGPGGSLHEECDPIALFPLAAQDTDTCDSDCTFAVCGDGHLNPNHIVTGTGSNPDHPEECDTGPTDSATCDSDCTAVKCGDGHVNKAAGEECDNGLANSNRTPDACRRDCRNAFCGDGVTDPGNNETCDDGNNDNTDGCPDGVGGNCKLAVCGDGFIRAGVEQCDDGNHDNSDACPDGNGGTCKTAFCGDGFVRTQGSNPEQCDNGSANDDTHADKCRTNCQKAHCGDNVKDTGEQCDPPQSACSGNGGICQADCTCG